MIPAVTVQSSWEAFGPCPCSQVLLWVGNFPALMINATEQHLVPVTLKGFLAFLFFFF